MENNFDFRSVPLNEYGHVCTRDGRPAKIVCWLREGNCLAVTSEHGKEGGFRSTANGISSDTCGLDPKLDLIPTPRKIKVDCWLNVYRDGTNRPGIHLSKERADSCALENRIACLHITQEVTEGEGL